ncbi:MAG: phosphatase PAP2 family protein [Proteobacteria bacterium]|nr:phosphatase PAP2 family protein [Pseudomonadota bacterium]
MLRTSYGRLAGWTLLALPLLLLWDASGLDLPLAGLFGTRAGFALRDNWFLVQIMHEGTKAVSWMVVLLLLASIVWPIGFLRRLDRGERAQLALSVIASVLMISLIKYGSRTSCPWDVDTFGGVARYVSHWSWGKFDGGPGKCFPAGHASAAFAFVGGYLVLARRVPGVARWWLAAAIVGGLLLGLAQQLRGAHYMSHTLWTAWICWTTGLVIDCACQWWRSRGAKPVVAAATAPRTPL